MLTIRLSRTGKRHKPQYRVVLQEQGRDPWSPALEILGNYNPHTSPSTVVLKEDRVKHWLSVGAQPSETVHNMLVTAGIIEEGKKRSVTISAKRSKKLVQKKADAEAAELERAEKAKAKAEAEAAEKAAAKEAAKAEAEAAKVAVEEAKKAEAPTEEAPATEEKAAE